MSPEAVFLMILLCGLVAIAVFVYLDMRWYVRRRAMVEAKYAADQVKRKAEDEARFVDIVKHQEERERLRDIAMAEEREAVKDQKLHMKWYHRRHGKDVWDEIGPKSLCYRYWYTYAAGDRIRVYWDGFPEYSTDKRFIIQASSESVDGGQWRNTRLSFYTAKAAMLRVEAAILATTTQGNTPADWTVRRAQGGVE